VHLAPPVPAFRFVIWRGKVRILWERHSPADEVRWNDRPREEGSTLHHRLREALSFGIDWSAAHARTGKTWAEAAANLPEEPAAGE
jgi:hypothetical protein